MDEVNTFFDVYCNRVFLKEGGDKYTNNPLDKGGPTRWGITEERARAAGYTGDMEYLPRNTAYNIYKLFYWTQPMFDAIFPIHAPLAGYMLDLGVNRGPSAPSKWLQRGLNVLNSGQKLYPDLIVDGVAGAMTRADLHSFVTKRGSDGIRVLMKLMQSFAAVDYVTIAEHDPSQEGFEYGWLSQRAFQDT